MMRAVWIVLDVVLLPLFLFAVVATFVFLVKTIRAVRPPWGVSPLAAKCVKCAGAAVVLLYLRFMFPPAGEGTAGYRGRLRGDAIIAALDRYREAHGAYPDSLSILVPDLLSPDQLQGPSSHYPFEYHLEGAEFSLVFQYVRVGMNVCSTTSRDRTWSCHGYL